ncbi:MAG: hypothetical protein ACK5LJ_16925 [Paracoccus sp. (in: a-proteobacteria)]
MQKAPGSFAFWDILKVARRNLPIILLLSILGAVGAYMIGKRITPEYEATAQLISDAGRSGLVAIDEAVPDQFGDASATVTMVETIPTPVVLTHALAAMTPELKERLAAQLPPPDPEEETAKPDPKADEQALLRQLEDGLDVTNSGRSFVVDLTYSSPDRILAAGAANAVAQGYLKYRVELRNLVYDKMLGNLDQQITELTNNLKLAEESAQSMREKLRLLGQRSDVWVEDQQDQAIAENAALYARQREAEREVAATAVVYEQLLLEHRQVESRLGEPEITVQLFSPAVVPADASGFNIAPVLLLLGLMTGMLAGLTIGLLREHARRPASGHAAASGTRALTSAPAAASAPQREQTAQPAPKHAEPKDPAQNPLAKDGRRASGVRRKGGRP